MSLYVYIEKKVKNFTLRAEFETDTSMLGLMGASGAGKSMLLKCIAGIEKPDSGRILLNGRVLFDSEQKIDLPPRKRRVGYLFQNYALFPHMTAAENIAVGMKKKDPDRVMKLLKQYRLEYAADRYPSQLSGGEQQRTALLRMLAAEPECVLLDEPFSALDETACDTVMRETTEILQDFRIPAVLVSHRREEIYRMTEEVLCMQNGRTGKIYTREKLFFKPETTAEARLIGCCNISPVRRIDENTVAATDWDDAILQVATGEQENLAKITHVGIFPKDLRIVESKAEITDRASVIGLHRAQLRWDRELRGDRLTAVFQEGQSTLQTLLPFEGAYRDKVSETGQADSSAEWCSLAVCPEKILLLREFPAE